MSSLHRRPVRRTFGSAELMYLLIVIAAGVGTAYWAVHRVGMDLSGITGAASALGLTRSDSSTHVVVGHQPGADAVTNQPPQTVALPADQMVAVPSTGSAPAPNCAPGQIPTFAAGLADLKDTIGEVMGAPIECEHPSSADGDTLQQTTTGLAAYDQLTNTVSFTDGWQHWALTPGGLVTWEGSNPSPPPD